MRWRERTALSRGSRLLASPGLGWEREGLESGFGPGALRVGEVTAWKGRVGDDSQSQGAPQSSPAAGAQASHPAVPAASAPDCGAASTGAGRAASSPASPSPGRGEHTGRQGNHAEAPGRDAITARPARRPAARREADSGRM